MTWFGKPWPNGRMCLTAMDGWVWTTVANGSCATTACRPWAPFKAVCRVPKARCCGMTN